MSELTTELDRLIQKAALDGALTEDAVAQFHDILAENEGFKTQLETDVDKIKADALMIDSLKTDLRIAQGLNKVAAEMEASLINREQKMTVLEMQAKYELTRVEDHKEMVKLIFRNLEVRRNVFPVSPAQHINDQGITAAGGFVEEREQTEKTE